MSALVKATLAEVTGSGFGTVKEGTEVPVQFNPSSLRVQISNKTAGGQQAGSQGRQRPGVGETAVAFDLVFDSADEGTTDAPVPVTKKTEAVEKFVRPKGNEQHQEAPPRVQFKWGTFVVHGVMESTAVELDFFSADGTPLRAKVSVSIKGQDPRYEYPPDGAGQGAGAGVAPPSALAAPPGAPGTSGTALPPASVAEAMPGEALPSFAARLGIDPTAWRALAAGISDPLNLSAGLEIGVPAALTGSLGGGSGAFTASPAAAVRALPLASSLPSAPGAAPVAPAPVGKAPDPLTTGKALAQGGGVASSIAGARAAARETARSSARRAFGVAESAAPAPAPADERAFGAGVPLRPRRGVSGVVAHTANPTVPGWQALRLAPAIPVRPLDRARPKDPCGCAGAAKARRGG